MGSRVRSSRNRLPAERTSPAQERRPGSCLFSGGSLPGRQTEERAQKGRFPRPSPRNKPAAPPGHQPQSLPDCSHPAPWRWERSPPEQPMRTPLSRIWSSSQKCIGGNLGPVDPISNELFSFNTAGPRFVAVRTSTGHHLSATVSLCDFKNHGFRECNPATLPGLRPMLQRCALQGREITSFGQSWLS